MRLQSTTPLKQQKYLLRVFKTHAIAHPTQACADEIHNGKLSIVANFYFHHFHVYGLKVQIAL